MVRDLLFANKIVAGDFVEDSKLNLNLNLNL